MCTRRTLVLAAFVPSTCGCASRDAVATRFSTGKGDSVREARLTESGEFLVEVVRRAPYCEPP
jgi:hypothetical protein